VEGILGEARRVRADVIVLGWRGHGALRRLLAGSVSRGVVRQAECSVLVVRRAARDVDRIVVGFDGSANAKRAVALVARLAPPRRGRVKLVTVPEGLLEVPSPALASRRLRGLAIAEGRRINEDRIAAARRALERPARKLAAAGWKVDTSVTTGPPLEDLLEAVRDASARLLVVGARGTGGVKRLLVGSVAQGALDRSIVPVLIVR
jgi:nucleotide-binding universal stress UspA family protein